jgi:hypothetical protein
MVRIRRAIHRSDRDVACNLGRHVLLHICTGSPTVGPFLNHQHAQGRPRQQLAVLLPAGPAPITTHQQNGSKSPIRNPASKLSSGG